MFAEVIPIRRTPFGLNGFDYSFPENETYEVGQLVYVPLRGHQTEAIIRAIKPTSSYAARVKAITGPIPVSFRFSSECLELLTWVAERTFSSLPTVLHAWLGALPKRLPKEPAPIKEYSSPKATGTASAHWQTDHESALVARAKTALANGQRVLILTPWTNRIPALQAALHTDAVPALTLHGDLNDGAYYDHWSKFLSGEASCLIATRLGAWLAPTADLVLIDEPENDDHKQDEQAPRYDARRLAGWAAKYAGVTVEAFGLTPPLHAGAQAPDIACELLTNVYHPRGRSAIPSIQADTLLTLEEYDGPRVIIHPIRGRAARLACRDCGWQALCAHCTSPVAAEADHAICRSCGKTQELPLACTACGGVDLGKAMPGIEQLKRAWEHSEPETPVEWRDTTNDQLEQPIPTKALVVVTIGQLLGGMIEDVRRAERRLIAIRRLMNRVAQAGGTLLIQSLEQDLPFWEQGKTGEGVKQIFETELGSRRLFHYPPTWRRVKCLIDGPEKEVATWIEAAKLRIAGQGTLEGPYKIEFRRAGASERTAVHLLFSPDTPENVLVELLQPLAKDALIDLDPIAFFK
jgi:primosomal protein N'